MDYSFDLVEPLKCLGITDLFEHDTANLAKMSPVAATEKLFVSNVVHKACIKVIFCILISEIAEQIDYLLGQ